MNLADAFHSTVLSYPGGAESLAPRMGMSPGILRNKAHPSVTTNLPSMADLDLLLGITGDYRALHALAANHGHVCVQIAEDKPMTEAALSQLIMGLLVRTGALGADVKEALADGVVTESEFAKVKDTAYKSHQNTLALLSALEKMAEK